MAWVQNPTHSGGNVKIDEEEGNGRASMTNKGQVDMGKDDRRVMLIEEQRVESI